MKVCPKCGDIFAKSNHLKIDGKIHNISGRKFCLKCSPFKKHNTLDLTEPMKTTETEKYCPKCDKIHPIGNFYPNNRKKGKVNSYCKTCHNNFTLLRQYEHKQKCLNYKGGKCRNCGYNKCVYALEFHHRDPKQKDIIIARLRCFKFDKRTTDELDKCDLLCSNCHREEHFRLNIKI